MRKIACIVIILFVCFEIQAKNKKIYVPYLDKKNTTTSCVRPYNTTVSVGYGAPSILRTFLKLKTPRKEFLIFGSGPFIFKTDFFIKKKWSIGVNITYSKTSVSWRDLDIDSSDLILKPFTYVVSAQELTYTARVNYHFKRTKKMDYYAGFGVGNGQLRISSQVIPAKTVFKVSYQFPRPLALETTAGFTFYPHKNIGFYSELGLGKIWVLEFFDRNYFVPDAIFQTGIRLKF